MRQFMHSFRGLTAPDDVLDGVRSGEITAFCLFAGINIESPAQLRALCQSLHDAAREGGQLPPIIGTDQEGGQLIAVTGGATELPGNMALGATGDEALAEAAGRVTARELLALGINMNFAPSIDVNNNPHNPAIGIRSFGEDPDLVARLGTAFIRGTEAEGVVAVAKHFPGHGDISVDAHFAEAIVSHDRARLDTIELKPFRAAAAGGVGAMMTAHVRYTALDERFPATISRRILSGLLREEIGYDGLIITDAMDMAAIAQHGELTSINAALDAGADLILLGHLRDQIELARRLGRTPNPESLARIDAVRRRLPREMLPFEIVGSAEHQTVAREIAERSITLVRDNGRLPLLLEPEQQIAVVTVRPANLTPADTSAAVTIGLDTEVRQRHANTIGVQFGFGDDTNGLIAALDQVRDADVVLVGTINASDDPSQAALIHALNARGQRPIVAALRTPYDLSVMPGVETYLCTYGIRRVTIQALVSVLFGDIPARGVLPCSIPEMGI